ncbi:MAG: T9SS type A sorting domain-containing protein [Bacteroidota bacterium]|nr:T9SS type A sorting domain-containing protein [Bacteroidota bacterium]
MKTCKVILTALIFLLTAQLYSQTFQWRLLPNSPGVTGGARFDDVYFIDSNTGWIIDYDGRVYKTTNGGNNWSLIFNSTFGNELRSVGFFDSNVGILGTLIEDTNKVLYRSTNGGSNWTPVSNITGQRPEGICGISIVNENIAYACGKYYGTGRIIKTTDKGNSWNSVFNDTSLATGLVDCYFWSPDSGISVGGYIDNAAVIKTTNGGASWERVHKTIQKVEWCWKISFISRDIGFVSIQRFSGSSYILKTTNNGLNWNEILLGNYNQQGIGFVDENTGWVGGHTGLATYKTTNGGLQWQFAGWGIGVNRFRFLNDTLAYAVGDRVYKYSREPVGINLISSEVPSSFQLQQNYPNPFNPVTKIKFDVPSNVKRQTSDVRLVIYDALGKEVVTLINEKLTSGSYEIDFDGSNFSSGIYFYKLQTDKFIETKRMILLK